MAWVGVELRLTRTTPDQSVVVYSGEAGNFPANDLKNLRVAKIGYQ